MELIPLLIFLVILLVIGWLLFYAIDLIPIGPPAAKNVLKILVILIGVLVIANRFWPGLSLR
jgi:hypothetical protein